MCLAVPMQVMEINDSQAIIAASGVQRRISLLLLPEAQVGDYVLVHAGFAIQKLDEAEAQETLRLWAELLAVEEAAEGEVGRFQI
jgi:hydrogenase expression/formation protein HypC